MTEQRIILNAPAKINLTLEVLKKRTDGYHDLRTVMHSIDVCDTVTVELSGANDGGIIVECTTPLPPVNTAFTAARLFREKTGCGGVRIQIKKRIPSEAGGRVRHAFGKDRQHLRAGGYKPFERLQRLGMGAEGAAEGVCDFHSLF